MRHIICFPRFLGSRNYVTMEVFGVKELQIEGEVVKSCELTVNGMLVFNGNDSKGMGS